MLDDLEIIQSAIYEVAKERGDEFRQGSEESPASGILKGLCVPATLTVYKILEKLGKESEVIRATVSKDEIILETHYFLLIPSEYIDLSETDTGKRMMTETVEYSLHSRERPMFIWDPTKDQYTSKLLIREASPKNAESALKRLESHNETMERFNKFYDAVFEKLEKTTLIQESMYR